MHNRIKLCALLFCAVFVLTSLAACGSEEPSSASEPTSVAPAAETIPGGAGRSAPEPEALENPPAESKESTPAPSVTEAPALQAKTLGSAEVFVSPEPGDSFIILESGRTVEVRTTDDILWYSITLDDGRQGYLYAENLVLDGSTENAAQTAVQNKLQELSTQFPDGKYWNHMGQELPFGQETPFSVTDEPCSHEIYGETYCNIYNGKTLDLFPQYGYLCQCLGFASFLSDQVFGADAPVSFFYDYDSLRVGDQIRLNEYEHSMIVAEKTDDYVVVAEVNADYEDCLISWQRQISRYELEYELSWDLEYISRYPMYEDESGALHVWEEEADTYEDGWDDSWDEDWE